MVKNSVFAQGMMMQKLGALSAANQILKNSDDGGSGGTTAAPIAKKLFKFIIDRHDLREETRKKNLIQNTI